MTLANKITLLRIALTPVFLICLIYDRYLPALIFLAACILTDALDGFYARRHRQITKIGAFIDPVADKSLLIPTYVIFVLIGIIPRWLFVLLISRDFTILSGWLYSLIMGHESHVEIVPRWSGKIAIAAQMAYFVLVMTHLTFPLWAAGSMVFFIELLTYIVALVTFVSFVDYLFIGSKSLAVPNEKNSNG